MSQRSISPAAYVVVDLILVVLTVLTVGLSFLPRSPAAHLASGLAIAIVKASLVVLFFMHALRSRAQTRAVIVITIFWLVAVFMGLTFTDYLTRGLIPDMPGH
jgi:cytochrome c oxidase subunit IV